MVVLHMLASAKRLKTCLITFLTLMLGFYPSFVMAQGVTLYTPYTKISVPPGESINYDIEVINKSGSVVNAALAVTGLPKGWTYTATSGGWNIGQISVLPKEKKNISLQVQVPLQVNKGTYKFYVSGKGIGTLPLTVEVSKEGTFKTEFSTTQPNMQGAANSTFTYTATLRNGTSADQTYSFHANTKPGWNVVFKADYKQVSSVNIEANKTKDITIEITPPEQVGAGKYKIPVTASTGSTSAELMLDLEVTGSYKLQLTTPSGLLSASTTAGDAKRVELAVKNIGTSRLNNIDLTSSTPSNWEVTFDPRQVQTLDPGATAKVYATIKPNKKAIAGDYVTSLEAKTLEVSSKVDFRISVETSILSGWLGLIIILLAIGSVYYLFRKYGRR